MAAAVAKAQEKKTRVPDNPQVPCDPSFHNDTERETAPFHLPPCVGSQLLPPCELPTPPTGLCWGDGEDGRSGSGEGMGQSKKTITNRKPEYRTALLISLTLVKTERLARAGGHRAPPADLENTDTHK